MDRLTFDEETHIYRLDGIEIPSVTQSLRSAGLLKFGTGELSNEAAMARGKAVHKACELYDLGTLDEASVHPSILGYLQAWKRFLAESGFKVLTIEERLWSRIHGFAGTLDRTGILNGQEIILEIKSGAYQDWWPLQLAGYEILLKSKTIEKIYSCFSLELRENGNYSLRRHENTEDEDVFLAAVRIHHWRQRQ